MTTATKRQDGIHTAGVGLDIGTMNIVAARQTQDQKIDTTPIRDAFLDLDLDARKSLKLSGVDHVLLGKEGDKKLVVLGDGALTMANLFKREARRPLSRGVISAGELDAQEILSLLISKVIGPPIQEKEHCYYSVPAAPLDDPSQDIVYHTEVFRKILQELGYTPHPKNEAMAIVISQCANDQFSGLSVSFGSGMCNVALAYQANCGMEFSVARGGDFIDQHAAKAVGKTASQMCAIKERGVDLIKPEGRDQQAIAMYIRHLIEYCLKSIDTEFRKVQSTVSLPTAIPFIVSGGTTKAGSFMALFEEEFEKVRKRFPIEISEIRQAKNPLTAVAQGLCLLAAEEYEDS